MNNSRGQIGMIYIIFGIVIAIVAVILLASMSGTMVSEWKDELGACSAFNCKGYIDRDATTGTCTSTNETYDSAYESDTLGCAIRGFGMGLFLILVLLGIIAAVLAGQSGSSPVQY